MPLPEDLPTETADDGRPGDQGGAPGTSTPPHRVSAGLFAARPDPLVSAGLNAINELLGLDAGTAPDGTEVLLAEGILTVGDAADVDAGVEVDEA